MNWLDKITPEPIRRLVPYASAGREGITGQVYLNANENPFPRQGGNLRGDLNRYPGFQPRELLAAYAAYAGRAENELLVTRGIDEGIDLLFRAFCRPGTDKIIYTPPTYGMYSISAGLANVKALAVPLLDGSFLDTESIIEKLPQAKLVFICSPNNPTGSLPDREAVLAIARAAEGQALVVVDEAYIEFTPGNSLIDELENYSSLVILRTMSKAFGLAGLRCGFVSAAPEIIEVLQKVSAPYPIPVPVVELAAAALSEAGIEVMREQAVCLNEWRERLRGRLEGYSFVRKIFPGLANYLLFEAEESVNLLEFCRSRGVIIRNQGSQVQLENCLRATIGTEAELDILTEIFDYYEELK